MNNKNYVPYSPFKLWTIQNFPFIEADFDAITNYQLYSKIVEVLKQVITNQNTLQNSNNELITAYNELVNYVNNYFENLDVQDEINNKLDEMAESGQLTDIIAQYLQLAGVLAYDTISDMSDAENLVDGSICYTLGQNTYNDGKGAFYKIREIVNTDVVDGVNIVALDVSNTLIGERINSFIELFGIINFNNIEELKNSVHLFNDANCKTSGYYSYNSGGSGFYKIRTKTNDDIADDKFIIELTNYPTLIGELIVDEYIDIMTIGCKPDDNTFDNSEIIEYAINKANEIGKNIILPRKIIYCSSPIIIEDELNNISITGGSDGIGSESNKKYTKIIYTGNDYFLTISGSNYLKLNNITFSGNGLNNLIHLIGNSNIINFKNKIENCSFINCVEGLNIENAIYNFISNVTGYSINNTSFLLQLTKNENMCELNTIKDSSFEGNNTSANCGIILDNVNLSYIINNDICNFSSGSGLLLKDVTNMYVYNNNFTRNLNNVTIDTSVKNVNDIIFDHNNFILTGTSTKTNETLYNFTRSNGNHEITRVNSYNNTYYPLSYESKIEKGIKCQTNTLLSNSNFNFINNIGGISSFELSDYANTISYNQVITKAINSGNNSVTINLDIPHVVSVANADIQLFLLTGSNSSVDNHIESCVYNTTTNKYDVTLKFDSNIPSNAKAFVGFIK